MQTQLADANNQYHLRPSFAKPTPKRLTSTNLTDEAMGETRTMMLRARAMASLYPNTMPNELNQTQLVNIASATRLTKRLSNDLTMRAIANARQQNRFTQQTNQVIAFYERLIQPRLDRDPQLKNAHHHACDQAGIDPNSPAGIALALQTAGTSIANDYDAQLAALEAALNLEASERAENLRVEAEDTEEEIEYAENQHIKKPEPNDTLEDETEEYIESPDDDQQALDAEQHNALDTLDNLPETTKGDFDKINETLKDMESHLEHGAVKGAEKIAEKAIETIAKATPELTRNQS